VADVHVPARKVQRARATVRPQTSFLAWVCTLPFDSQGVEHLAALRDIKDTVIVATNMAIWLNISRVSAFRRPCKRTVAANWGNT